MCRDERNEREKNDAVKAKEKMKVALKKTHEIVKKTVEKIMN